MSSENLVHAFSVSGLNPLEKLVLIAVADGISRVERIAKFASADEGTEVIPTLSRLRDRGYISRSTDGWSDWTYGGHKS